MHDARHDDFLRRFTAAQLAVRRFVWSHVPDPQEAEDIVQNTALVLWKKFDQYDPKKHFVTWAFGIARNEVLYARRTSARKPLVLADDVSVRLGERLALLSARLDPRWAFLESCLKKLAEKARGVLEMHYHRRLSTDQIARTLRSSVNAVRLVLFRAREALARCVGEEQRLATREEKV